MKIEIGYNGTLCIAGETSLETFALTHWVDMYRADKAAFVIETARKPEGGGATVINSEPVTLPVTR